MANIARTPAINNDFNFSSNFILMSLTFVGGVPLPVGPVPPERALARVNATALNRKCSCYAIPAIDAPGLARDKGGCVRCQVQRKQARLTRLAGASQRDF